ncbi:SDR family oxidoreductase [uncultured Cohaesibacter sp.]|uniref:SDR family NAD(P)-dependent oxidoreductase n=1 Tax=uncultured Cohaesibacter sp. TaxID=1002546 RepID=UPI00292F7F0C|nr:SDR family oxidoreductase [uncultured Cohaesibacter sp.]
MDNSSSSSLPLYGSAIFVSGAAGHLGRAIVEGIARDGGVPILNGRNGRKLEAVAEDLERSGHDCLIAAGDVSDCAQIDTLLADSHSEVERRGLRFDGMVNNAYAGQASDTSETIADLFTQVARTNIGAVAHLVYRFSELSPHLPKSVVNVASMYGMVSPDPGLYPDGVAVNPIQYGATKAGLIQLTRYLAVNLANRNIRVNAISPGPFPTGQVQTELPQFISNLETRVPLKRIGQAAEVYPAVRFLLRSDASYVTGINVPIDGGWTAI